MQLIKRIVIFGAIGIIVFCGYKAISAKGGNIKHEANMSSEIEYIVKKGYISNSASGSGSINPTDKRTIKSEINGRVENVYVKEGDVVQKDQTLISLKSDVSGNDSEAQSIREKLEENKNQLNELYKSQGKLNVYANMSGVVKGLNSKIGDEIVKNQSIGAIEDTEYVYAQSYFFDKDIENIKVGDKATVFISEFLSEHEGEIVSVNHLPVQFGGGIFGYEVIAKIKNLGGMTEGNITQITVNKDSGDIESSRAGKMQKNKEENIESSIGGKIADIKIKNGQRVNKGDLLFTLESEETDKNIEQLEKEIQRYNGKLNNIYKGHTVYSPIAGTVLKVEVSNDDVVDRSTTLITIANLDGMEVVLSIDELDILNLEIGQTATLKSDVFEDEFFTGKISNISLEGNSQNGVTTYSVTVSLDDRKKLMSGMNVSVNILVENKQDILTVPIESLIKTMDGYIVKVKGKDGAVADVKVETGSKDKYNAEIISGLKEGDIVIYTANNSMTPPTSGSTMVVRPIQMN